MPTATSAWKTCIASISTIGFDLLGRPIVFQLLSQNEGRTSLQLKQGSPGLFFIELNGKVYRAFSIAQ